MIEQLKNDEIIAKVGGRFKLAALMQKRWIELMQGSRPLVDPKDKGDLEIIAQEIMEEKIAAVRCEEAPSESEPSDSESK